MFTPLYEFFENTFKWFRQDFAFIFTDIYNTGAYDQMGLILIFFPLFALGLFYFLLKYPYLKLWHWIGFVVIIAFIVGGTTYGFIRQVLANYILDPDEEIATFAQSLTVKYSFLNGSLSLLISFPGKTDRSIYNLPQRFPS